MKPLLLIIGLFVLISCSSNPKSVDNVASGEPPPTSAASIEAKQVAAENEASAVIEIAFKKNSATLNAGAKQKIKDLLAGITNEQRVDQIKVISWADQEYPSEKVKKLSEKQVALARQRNEAIQSFVKSRRGKLKIEILSMAERPGKLSDFWGGENARLKKSFETAGIATSEKDLGKPSKASQSVVMVVLKRVD